MTTEQLHEELRQHGFYKIGTGGGCDALVRHIPWMEIEPEPKNKSVVGVKAKKSCEVMLTAYEDASVPEADDQIQITLRMEGSDYEVTWLATPSEAINFAASVSVWPNSNK
jgi:hypothetical protein